MIFDYQQATLTFEGMVTFPDFPFAALPTQPGDIKETVLITGSTTGGTSIAITGTMDQGE